MGKIVDGATIELQMWATIELTAEEIIDIYPELQDIDIDEDIDLVEKALEEHMDFNYLDLIQYADGGLDETKITFQYEDDGAE